MPGLEIRYLAFNTDAPSVKDKAVRQAMAQVINRGELVSKVYGSQAEPLYSLVPASITGHSNSFFNKYGEPERRQGQDACWQSAGITTPVKLTLHYTTDHYGPATKQEFEVLQKQLNASGLFDVTIKGAPWATFRPAEQKGEYDVYGMGWFPDFPDADNYLAPVPRQGQLPQLARTPTRKIRNTLIPESRREADRLAAAESLTEHPGHRRRRRTRPAAVAGQAVRRRPRRHHGRGVGAQLLLDPPALGARPRRERLTCPPVRRTVPTRGWDGPGYPRPDDKAHRREHAQPVAGPAHRGGAGLRPADRMRLGDGRLRGPTAPPW